MTEKTNHSICYCAGRPECHNCGWPFGDYGDNLDDEQVKECEALFCPTYEDKEDGCAWSSSCDGNCKA